MALANAITTEDAESMAELSSNFLAVHSRGRIVLLKTAEIDFIEADGNYVAIHASRECYLVRETMAELERRLAPARFVRIHRSTIVNLARIKEIHPWFHGHHVVVLSTGDRLRLSRYQRSKLAFLFP